MINDSNARKFKTECKIHQQEAQNSIAWANFVMKNHYDKYHILLLLNFKNLVILKLHHEYHISDVKNKKLFIQQVDCFFVKWQVSSLAYELKLSANMKIHSVMSVINLESVSSEKDLYNWSYNDHLSFMKEDCDIDDEWKSFYIEKLLDYHLCHYEHDKQIIKYLIKWTDYKSEFNEWYEKNLLDNVIKLILEYEICQNSNSDHIIYLHKLLTVSKTESAAVSNNLSLKKQHCKSKQMTWSTWLSSCQNAAVYTHSFAVWYHLQFDIMCDLILSTLIHSIFLIQSQLHIY